MGIEDRSARRKLSNAFSCLLPRTVLAAFVLSAGVFALEATPANAADFTWTGGGANANWSTGANWGGTAPSGTVGTLTFPASACGGSFCLTQNDLSGLSANALSLDLSGPFIDQGNALTLGGGGITTSASGGRGTQTIAMPIALSAPQTWTVNGCGETIHGGCGLDFGFADAPISGSSDALGVSLSNDGFLGIASDGEVGPVNITGASPGAGDNNGIVSVGFGGALNATDGNSVSVNNAGLDASLSTFGPVSVGNGAFLFVGSISDGNGNTMTVNGSVTLASQSGLGMEIFRAGTTAGTDYAQLRASGDINLGGANLLLDAPGIPGHCTTLHPGDVDTLITTTGSVTGTFSGIPDGTVVPVQCGTSTSAFVQINYTAHTVTATVLQPFDGGPIAIFETNGGGSFCWACFGKKLLRVFFGWPVDSANGNMYDTSTDISIPGRGSPLALSRTYNADTAGTNGPLGFGWVDNLGASLAISSNTAVLTEENGAQTTFTLNGGTWSAPPRDIATLTHNPDGTWTLVRHAQQSLTFNSSGQLTAMSDLNGYTTSYAYTGGQLTSVTDSSGRQLQLGYTGGLLTTVTDSNVSPARVVHYQYNDGNGNLTDVIDVNGGHAHYVYDASHRITAMFSPKCYATVGCPGVVTHYNAAGQVDSQTDQVGRQTTFSYSGDPTSVAGGTTTVTDPKGNVTVEDYNNGARVSETRGYGTPQAATTTYLYDPATAQPTAITDPNGNQTSMSYDASGNMLTKTDPLNRTTTETYNSLNEPLTIQDPLGVTTTNTYDANGNLLTTSRPLVGTGQTQQATYAYGDAGHPGDVTSMTDPDGKLWTYTYDANGDPTSTTDPLGNMSTSTYNAIGWLLTTVSPRGNAGGANPADFTTTYSYADPNTSAVDEFGDVRTVTDPLGHVTTYGYDPDRNRTSVTDPNGNTTTNTYDVADEQTAVHRADGTTLHTSYWPDSTVKDQVDGAGHVTHHDYDPLARESAVTDPLGRTTSYAYDPAGNRTSSTDPQGRVTTMTYDAANQLTGISYSDGTTPNVSNITYDADGQRTGQTDGSGGWTWTWDSLHRLASVTEGANGTVSYLYDLRNHPTQIAYPGGHVVTRGYDDAGRWTSVTDWLGNTTTFAYDLDGNLTGRALPSGTGITDTSTYAHDDSLSSISDKQGSNTLFSANYARDANRQLTGDTSAPPSANGYGYTALNQICYAGSSGGAPCSSPPSGAAPYQYDSADNLVQNAATTQTFDAANELTSAQDGSSSTALQYDPMGNRTSALHPDGSGQTLAYDQADRLTSVSTVGAPPPPTPNPPSASITTPAGGATYQLNQIVNASYSCQEGQGGPGIAACAGPVPSGSPIDTSTPGQHTFTVTATSQDGQSSSASQNYTVASSPPHRPKCKKKHGHKKHKKCKKKRKHFATSSRSGAAGAAKARSAGTSAASYAYNGDGLRMTKTVGGAANPSAGTSVASYAYNGDGLRMTKTVGGAANPFVWDVANGAPSLLRDGANTYVYGPGGLPLEQISGSNVLWLHHDQLGSTRLITDSAGHPAATFAYTPYGSVSTSTGTASTPFLFAGQYLDSESGYYYLRARYYDPTTAQFLTRDPAVATTMSPYAYVGGDPVNGTDPSGRDCPWYGLLWCGAQGAAGVASGVAQGTAGVASGFFSALGCGVIHPLSICAGPNAPDPSGSGCPLYGLLWCGAQGAAGVASGFLGRMGCQFVHPLSICTTGLSSDEAAACWETLGNLVKFLWDPLKIFLKPAPLSPDSLN